jgi:hypothetical protein
MNALIFTCRFALLSFCSYLVSLLPVQASRFAYPDIPALSGPTATRRILVLPVELFDPSAAEQFPAVPDDWITQGE